MARCAVLAPDGAEETVALVNGFSAFVGASPDAALGDADGAARRPYHNCRHGIETLKHLPTGGGCEMLAAVIKGASSQ